MLHKMQSTQMRMKRCMLKITRRYWKRNTLERSMTKVVDIG